MEYQKTKSASKEIVTKGNTLSHIILKTMKTISDIVGVTLGPGGQPVLIERYEHDLPSIVTKDGVTVMKSLGFNNSSSHCILEAARDAAVRTANEAGDGTSSATILAEAIVRLTSEYCKRNPRISPQKIIRKLQSTFSETIEKTLLKLSHKPNFGKVEGKTALRNIAKISTNGDLKLAEAVMECFDQVGDAGNVTIAEISGSYGCKVEKVAGYPISMGYELTAAKFAPKFINDNGKQMCRLEKPVFIVYHGDLRDIQTILPLLAKVGDEFTKKLANDPNSPSEYDHHNIVVIATGFSESVLGTLASNFPVSETINVLPLLAPKSPLHDGQLQFLLDVCAVTGASLFDPINFALEKGTLGDLGPGMEFFECGRWNSTILGDSDEGLVLDRVTELEGRLKAPDSELDKKTLEEQLAKLTRGIARLIVVGSSNGELKERRDRAEDAVCAVRGAIKHGCLPGGGWALMKLCHVLTDDDPVIAEVLKPALMAPVIRLLENCGINEEESLSVLRPILEGIKENKQTIYDALEQKHGDAFELGVLDSTPAVLEAIRNSLSIASLLGTLGGVVNFSRDVELERNEAVATQQFIRDSLTQTERE